MQGPKWAWADSNNPRVSAEKPQVEGTGGAKCGALPDDSAPRKPVDPDLVKVVAAWADLPPAIRAAIVAMAASFSAGAAHAVGENVGKGAK